MAKGQQRGNRETKKPKQENKAKPSTAPSPFSTLPPGKGAPAGGKKK
ncbi:hypothetical protein STVA_50900 [Allostella vacuolata]|nr:hypothetical protein STVA_50900 [Stella vacuolata]